MYILYLFTLFIETKIFLIIYEKKYLIKKDKQQSIINQLAYL